MVSSRRFVIAFAIIAIAGTSACARRNKTAATPQPAPTVAPPPAVTPPPPAPRPAQRVEDLQPAAPGLSEDAVGNRSLDDLNRDSPLKPAFFLLDSADLDD